MILKNKNTGEIVAFGEGIIDLTTIGCKNVAEMIEAGWEDYKEPSDKIENIWTGNRREKTVHIKCNSEKYAKEVLLKLKAWKRLKEEKEVKFEGWKRDERYWGDYTIKMTDQSTCDDKDLDLLFGGGNEQD